MTATNEGAGLPESSSRAGTVLFILWVALVAAILRCLGWTNWSLWLDEAMTLDYVRRGFHGMWEILILEGNHPPGHYLVTYVVRHISETDAALRIPSVIFGVATTLALYVRCGGRRRMIVGLGAAFSFATLPLAVHFGQEVRPYAMALCFVAVADAARSTWVRTRSRTSIAVWLVASLIAAYSLYVALVALAAILFVEIAVAWRSRSQDPGRLRAALFVACAVAFLYAPWLWAIRHGLHQPPGAGPELSFASVWGECVGLAAGRDENLGRQAAAAAIWLGWLVGLGMAEGEERARLVVEMAALTVGVLFALWWGGHWWNVRYVIMAALPLSRGLGEALGAVERLRGRYWKGAALTVPFVALGAIQSPAIIENVETGRSNWRHAADYLEFQSTKGRRGEILAADGWAYFCLKAQTTRRADPRDVRLVNAGEPLGALVSALSEGWIARAPNYRNVPAEIDAFLGTVAPWATINEADGVRIYRFEKGRLVP